MEMDGNGTIDTLKHIHVLSTVYNFGGICLQTFTIYTNLKNTQDTLPLIRNNTIEKTNDLTLNVKAMCDQHVHYYLTGW